MPVYLDTKYPTHDRQAGSKRLCEEPQAPFQERSSRCLTIGLINNMPDGALEATERQFISLLDSASDGIQIRLLLYALPGVPRRELAEHRVRNFYSSVELLWDRHLDGLIVTGREPLTPNLADEPYWGSFTRVLEWAQQNTHSTVWSCLAAHAAILHMDGIRRIKNDDKQFGIFESARISDHQLTAGAASSFRLPHSRWNGIPEDELTDSGYSVLTRSSDVGVDTFVKQQRKLFVFFQGHPEYESDTLLHEYRRDVGRYLKGETDKYPSMPQNYFDETTVGALTVLRERAISCRGKDLLTEASTALGSSRIENTWRSTAACIYRNWLEYICTEKENTLRSTKIKVNPGACRLRGTCSNCTNAGAGSTQVSIAMSVLRKSTPCQRAGED
jgi:homoserine O-succinyltransferase